MSVGDSGELEGLGRVCMRVFIRRHVAGIPKANSIALGTNLGEILSKFVYLQGPHTLRPQS